MIFHGKSSVQVGKRQAIALAIALAVLLCGSSKDPLLFLQLMWMLCNQKVQAALQCKQISKTLTSKVMWQIQDLLQFCSVLRLQIRSTNAAPWEALLWRGDVAFFKLHHAIIWWVNSYKRSVWRSSSAFFWTGKICVVCQNTQSLAHLQLPASYQEGRVDNKTINIQKKMFLLRIYEGFGSFHLLEGTENLFCMW